MPTTKSANFSRVRNWLNEINREKQAAAKAAKAHTEPGGYVGETTHPSKDVDDNCEDAREGARSAENERDIKEMEPAGNVNSTSEGGGKSQADLNYNIGVHQSATGEAPEVEDDYRSDVKDPGTSHPANAEKVGPKYGAWVKKEAAELGELANSILAEFATQAGVNPNQTKPTNNTATTNKSASTTTTQPVQAAQAGYELAAQLGLTKQAADQQVQYVLADTIKQAQFGADRVGAFLVSFIKESETLNKQAAGEPPVDPAALAAMAQGGGAGGPPPGPEGGGDMPPEMGGGGPPPDAGGPPGAGGGGNEQALQELAMALMELGISPEQLAAMAQQQGGAGGMPPGGPPMGGAGPEEGPPPDAPAKIASAIHNYKLTGKFRVSEAKTASQRAYRDELKSYILEVVGANRR